MAIAGSYEVLRRPVETTAHLRTLPMKYSGNQVK